MGLELERAAIAKHAGKDSYARVTDGVVLIRVRARVGARVRGGVGVQVGMGPELGSGLG